MTPEELAKLPCVIEWQEMPPPNEERFCLVLSATGRMLTRSWANAWWTRDPQQFAFAPPKEDIVAWAEMPTKTLEQAIEERARTAYIGEEK